MRFDIDDRVYYVSGNFTLGVRNPRKGSKYECQGTVIYSDGLSLRVNWDNGNINGYLESDLELVSQLKQTDPNTLFKRR